MGANDVKASYRLTLKIAETKITIMKVVMGRSNGEVLNRNLTSIIVLKLNIRSARELKIISNNSFGSTNASVVILKKRTGKAIKSIPTINRHILSR